MQDYLVFSRLPLLQFSHVGLGLSQYDVSVSDLGQRNFQTLLFFPVVRDKEGP